MSSAITSISPKSIVIFGKAKGCVQCDATDRTLAKTDLSFTKKNGTTEENKAFCLTLGYMQAPVVVVYQDGVVIDSFSGFNPGKIDELKNDPLVERVPAEANGLAA
jgi:glutaredoxin-like protein NrdH